MSPAGEPSLREREAILSAGERTIRGTLRLPARAGAVVVFAHGSGSGRFSPRNQYVAQVLEEAGLGTLLLDDRWKPLEEDKKVGLWTDDYTPLLSVLQGEWNLFGD